MVVKHFLVGLAVTSPGKPKEVLHISRVIFLVIRTLIRLDCDSNPEASLVSIHNSPICHASFKIEETLIGVMLIQQMQKLHRGVQKDNQAQRQTKDTTQHRVHLVFSFEVKVRQRSSKGVHSFKHFASGPRSHKFLLFCAFSHYI